MIITENCIVPNMPEKAYHADPTPVLEGFAMSASFSSSIAKIVSEKTEEEAFLQIKRLNPKFVEKESSDGADLGTVAHAYVLQGGKSHGVYEIAPYDAWRSNDAKAAKADIESRGIIALNTTTAPRLVDDVKLMHARLHEQLQAHRDFPGLMMSGQGELSCFVKDPKTGIWLRARIDWDDKNYADWVFDYKTTGLTFDKWEKNQLWGDDGALYMQAAHYAYVKGLLTGRSCNFAFVVQQTSAPFHVKIFVIEGQYNETVHLRYENAKARFAHCLKTGVWRGQPPYTAHSAPPPWVFNKWELEALNNEIIAQRDNPKQPEPPQDLQMAG